MALLGDIKIEGDLLPCAHLIFGDQPPAGSSLGGANPFRGLGYWIGLIIGVGVLTFSILLRLMLIQRRHFVSSDVE